MTDGTPPSRAASVHDRVPGSREERRETHEAACIPDRPDLAPDDVEVDQSQACASNRRLEVRVDREDVHLEATLLSRSPELQHENAVAPKGRRALDVEEPRTRQLSKPVTALPQPALRARRCRRRRSLRDRS